MAVKYDIVKAKVFFAQDLRKLAKRFYKAKRVEPILFVEHIDHFTAGKPKDKRALVTLPPWAWYTALQQAPYIGSFNFTGLLYEIVKGLNENGYIVDIIDLEPGDYRLRHQYNLLVAHGRGCEPLIQQLMLGTPILQYVSGAYYKGFIEESDERYRRFAARNHISEPVAHKRPMHQAIKGEAFLTSHAHYLFSCNAPRMVSTFGAAAKKFFFTGLAAYIDKDFIMDSRQRNFVEGRKNFIYVGGTSGNIQKGLDLILEAFAQVPDANLFIYCELEPEILMYYKPELSAKNIHYIYHYRYLSGKLKALLPKINYSIHAPINTGIGTAFAGTMGAGFIPVGYIDIPQDSSWNILSEHFGVGHLVACIKQALVKEPQWCSNASIQVEAYFMKNWSVQNFVSKFDTLIKKVNATTQSH